MLFATNRFGVAKSCSAGPLKPWLNACGAGRWSEFVALTPTHCRRGRSVHSPRFHAFSQGSALATLSPSKLPMVILAMTLDRFGWSTLGLRRGETVPPKDERTMVMAVDQLGVARCHELLLATPSFDSDGNCMQRKLQAIDFADSSLRR